MSPNIKPKIESIDGHSLWRLKEDFVFEVLETGAIHKVPAGFTFNGASIPRVFWPIVGHPMEGSFLSASLLHDWCCVKSKKAGKYTLRVAGDALFYHMLCEAGVPFWRRAAMYLAVRLQGWWTFKGGWKS